MVKSHGNSFIIIFLQSNNCLVKKEMNLFALFAALSSDFVGISPHPIFHF